MAPDLTKFSSRRSEFLRAQIAKNVWPLYFHGPAGRQKTMSAALMYVEWACDPCIFLRMGDVYADMNEVDGRRGALRSTMRDYSLVVLDDVGDRNVTAHRQAAILDLINWRDGRPLILTGNLSPTELPALFEDRVVSRILSGCSLLFEGPDMRLSGMSSVKVPI